MNIDIDLLPQSRKTKVRKLPVLVALIIGVVLLFGVLLFTYVTMKTSVQLLENQISRQTALKDDLQEKYVTNTNGITTYNFAESYQQTTAFFSDMYQSPVMIQENMYELLPRKAAMIEYYYENSGSLVLTVDFASKKTAATYLGKLLTADLVTNATVETMVKPEEANGYETVIRVTFDPLAGDQR